MEQNHTILWEKCLAMFRDYLSPEQFDHWFKPVTAISYKDNVLNLNVPSSFFVEMLEERYFDLLSKTLHKVFGRK